MAIDVSEIYCRYEDQHRLSSSECHEMCSTVHYSRSVQDSKALADQAYPHVIIAGSGMATGGRILHHFKRLLGQHRTTVIFAGYQAGGTRGAKMVDGAERIKIHGDWIPVKARLEVLSGLSGHGDFTEIEQWLAQSDLAPETPINLIHGDPDALEAMKDHLRQNTRFEVEVASYQSILRL
jgi:metallo-beta-lactamase family protein